MRLLAAIPVAATGVVNAAAVQSSLCGDPKQSAARFYIRLNADGTRIWRSSLDGTGQSSASASCKFASHYSTCGVPAEHVGPEETRTRRVSHA
jgi:hypothetical protein